jgi:LuxR family maltose regulon positive regulatory protein
LWRSPAGILVEPLTPRELDTLRLLALDLTVDEIADQMVVSVATVRSHTNRIYSKLDTHSRHEAIFRAKDLGII